MTPNRLQILECIYKLEGRWQDRHGLIHTRPVGEDGEPATLNGVLYTGIVYAMIERAAEKAGCQNDPEIVEFLVELNDAILACLEPKYPMVSRSPTNQDQEGPDDYKGLSVWAAYSPNGQIAASDLLILAENSSVKLKWYLPRLRRWLNNSGTPDRVFDDLPADASFLTKLLWFTIAPWGKKVWLSPWMGRFPALTAAFEAVVGRKPSWIPSLFTFLTVGQQALFGNSKKPDSWYMDWTVIVCNEISSKPSKLVKLVEGLWFKRLHKLYPNGMRDVWKQYVGPEHAEDFPLGQFFQE